MASKKAEGKKKAETTNKPLPDLPEEVSTEANAPSSKKRHEITFRGLHTIVRPESTLLLAKQPRLLRIFIENSLRVLFIEDKATEKKADKDKADGSHQQTYLERHICPRIQGHYEGEYKAIAKAAGERDIDACLVTGSGELPILDSRTSKEHNVAYVRLTFGRHTNLGRDFDGYVDDAIPADDKWEPIWKSQIEMAKGERELPEKERALKEQQSREEAEDKAQKPAREGRLAEMMEHVHLNPDTRRTHIPWRGPRARRGPAADHEQAAGLPELEGDIPEPRFELPGDDPSQDAARRSLLLKLRGSSHPGSRRGS